MSSLMLGLSDLVIVIRFFDLCVILSGVLTTLSDLATDMWSMTSYCVVMTTVCGRVKQFWETVSLIDVVISRTISALALWPCDWLHFLRFSSVILPMKGASLH